MGNVLALNFLLIEYNVLKSVLEIGNIRFGTKINENDEIGVGDATSSR